MRGPLELFILFCWIASTQSSIFVPSQGSEFESIPSWPSGSIYCRLQLPPYNGTYSFCDAPPSQTLNSSDIIKGVGVVVSRGEDCELKTKLKYAKTWIRGLRAYPYGGVIIVPGFKGDGGEIFAEDLQNLETFGKVVLVSFRTGEALMQLSHDPDPFNRELQITKTSTSNKNVDYEGGSRAHVFLYLVSPFVVVVILIALNKCRRPEGCCPNYNYVQPPASNNATPSMGEVPAKLLTEDQINQLVGASLDKSEAKIDDGDSKELSARPCAICIEDCDDTKSTGSLIMNLPCSHKFHVDCIVPWLTKRKAQCPLCNDDLVKRLRSESLVQSPTTAVPQESSSCP